MAVFQGAALATLLLVASFVGLTVEQVLADTSSYYGNGTLGVTFATASAGGGGYLSVCVSPPQGWDVCSAVTDVTGPPKPLFVAMPNASGTYPVLIFQHGTDLVNSFYSQLMQHIASYGYIVVAPQMYTVAIFTDASQEIKDAAAVINWLPTGLPTLLSTASPTAAPQPDLSQVAIAGHSRGGKVAFALALGFANVSLPFSAVAGVDPVDGGPGGKQTQPPVLRFSPAAFALPFPSLLIGSGLGNQSSSVVAPACAPAGFGHREFFSDSAPPAYHFVASDFGHMDFLDDVTPGIIGVVSYHLCKNGPSRTPERTFAGGLLVAFLESVFRGNGEYLQDALDHPEHAPVAQEDPQAFLPQSPPNRQQQASF